MCNPGSTAIDSEDENNCTFVDVRSAVWLTDYKILVYDKRASRFRMIEFEGTV